MCSFLTSGRYAKIYVLVTILKNKVYLIKSLIKAIAKPTYTCNLKADSQDSVNNSNNIDQLQSLPVIAPIAQGRSIPNSYTFSRF